MNQTLIFEGSEVCAVEVHDKDVHVVLSAAFVRRGESGASRCSGTAPEWGYLKPVTLRLLSVSEPLAEASSWLGALSDGSLQHGARSDRELALPCQVQGGVTLTLAFKARSELVLQAQALRCEPDASSRFIESFAC